MKYIGEFINSAQQHISKQDCVSTFYPGKQIKSAIQIMSPKAKKRGIKIKIKKLHRFTIFGSKNKLLQVIINLISNSIDSYNFPQKNENKEIIISLEKTSKNLMLSIKDFGIGISNKIKKKIFEPMYTTKNPQVGIGLGLSIVKSIIEDDFKGKISVESKVSKGTTFTIKIPIHRT